MKLRLKNGEVVEFSGNPEDAKVNEIPPFPYMHKEEKRRYVDIYLCKTESGERWISKDEFDPYHFRTT